MVVELPDDPPLPGVAFAAPGSGKTRRIIGIACNHLERGVPGDRLVLLTFTREAASQLQVRLLQRTIGTPLEAEAKRVFAGTVDSYALSLLHTHDPEMRGWGLLGNPAALVRLLHARRALDLWSLFPSPPTRQWETTGDKVRRFVEHMQYIYNESRTSEQMRRSNPTLAAAIDVYWAEMEVRHRLDFGTVVRALHALLDRDAPALADEHAKTFLVDEGQDLNTNQLLLIERLAGRDRRLLVVGDDDQQMYSWRGSDPTNLRTAMQRMGATPYTLATNYRSTDDIIQPAHALIRRNTRRFGKHVKGRGIRGESGDVTFQVFPSVGAETQAVVRLIQGTVGKSYVRPGDMDTQGRGPSHEVSYRDVLVLVRWRSPEALTLVAQLRAAGIPVDATNVLNVEKHPYGKLAIDALRYVIYEGPGDRVGLVTDRNLVRSLTDEFGLAQIEVIHFLNCLTAFRDSYFAESQRRQNKPWAFAQKVFHAFVQSVMRTGWPGELDDEMELILGVLSTAVRDYEDVTPRIGGRGLRWLVETLHQKDGLPNKSPGVEAPDAVRVFTVHNAKGLEADLVLMPFAVSTSYPMLFGRDPATWLWSPTLDPPYAEGVEQERNLFYVGMTRARRFLHITCSDKPSPFIAEAGLQPTRPATPAPLAPRPAGARPVKELVTTMSDLRLAQGCGYRYRLAKALGYHPGASTQIGYGNSIHIINQVNLNHFRDHGQGMDRPTYDQHIPRLTHLPYAWGGTRDDLANGIQKQSVRLWLKWNREPPLVLDTEVGFTIPLTNVTIIEGRSDILAQLHGSKTLWNVDLKTRAYTARQASLQNPELAWDVITQQIYHLGLQDVVKATHGRRVDRSQLYFGRPDVHTEIPTAPANLGRAADAVETIADDIQKGNLQAKPGPKCATCDFKLVCRFAPKNTLAEDAEVAPLLRVPVPARAA
jgi:DNA helicase-2/ATP-dependent DNA helicase PcrA